MARNWQDWIDTPVCMNCFKFMAGIPDSAIGLIVVDPPYNKVKGEPWDRQWDTVDDYINWMDRLCQEFYRLLKPNGSLYLFASPRLAARVEVAASKWFNVLTRIRWVKEEGWHKKAVIGDLRSYLSPWEEIVFAEHYGSDGYAKGELGYQAKSDGMRGFVFEPLRAYLDGERQRAGLSRSETGLAIAPPPHGEAISNHYFRQGQWMLPTMENYQKLRHFFNEHGDGQGPFLTRPYEALHREYEALRCEYENLRRPFNATTDMPYTDVWTFPTVQAYPGKHPCEKPLAMLEHIIEISSRPGDLVLDCCAGSFTTMMAAIKLGRRCLACDISERYCEHGVKATQKIKERQLAFALPTGENPNG